LSKKNASFIDFIPVPLDLVLEPFYIENNLNSAKILLLDGTGRKVKVKYTPKFISISIPGAGYLVLYPPRDDRGGYFGARWVKWNEGRTDEQGRN
jgi:hypothetical protein